MTAATTTERSLLERITQDSGGALVLLAMVVICYAWTASFGYIWDDDTYVQNNIYLYDIAGLSRMWTHIGATPQYYPITFTSFWIEYQVAGLNPMLSHIVNFMLHGASVVMLWKILAGLRVPGAWFAAAIFAVHPLNVESVAWISERKNTLSLAFGMAALLVYLRYAGLIEKNVSKPVKKTIQTEEEADEEGGVDLSLPEDPKRLYGLFFILYLCALLSKTTLAVLPGVVLVIVWWKQGRLTRRDLMPLIAPIILGTLAVSLTSWIERNEYLVGASGKPWSHTLVDRLALAGQVSWFYAGKLLTPHPFVWNLPESMRMGNPPWFILSVPGFLQNILPPSLNFNYPRWTLDAKQVTQWIATVCTVVVVVVLWIRREKMGRGTLAGVMIYLGCLIPAMGFANVYPMRFSWVADHFAYVGSIGLIVLFAAGAARLAGRWKSAPVLAALMLAALTASTIAYSGSFRDLRTLYTHTLLRNDQSWLAAANLGAYMRGTADQLFADELPQAQDQDEYRRKLARMYHEAGLWLNRAKVLNPNSHEVPFQQAFLAMRVAQPDEAMNLAMESERIAQQQGVKQFIYPKLMIASLYVQKDQLDLARQMYLDLQPLESKMGDKIPLTFADARISLANLDRKLLSAPISPNLSEKDSQIVGDIIVNLTAATELAPQRPGAKLQLARIMIDLGQTDQAYELASQVLSQNKHDPDAKLVVAEGLEKDGNFQLAAAQLSNLIQTHPRHLPARMRFVQMLVKLDRKDDAIRELEALITINAKYPGASDLLQQLKGSTTQPTTTQQAVPAPMQ